MRKHLPTALVLAGLMGSVALPAAAQQAPSTTPPAPAATAPVPPPGPVATPAAPSAPAEPTPDHSGMQAETTSTQPMSRQADSQEARAAQARSDREAFFNADVAALHAGLGLTPDQEKLWPPVEAAIRDVATMRRHVHEAMMERHAGMENGGPDASGAKDMDPIARLKRTSDLISERGNALGALADAAGPLYASLNAEQRHRLPILLRDMAPRRGPIAKLVSALDGSDEGGHPAMHEPGPRMDQRGGDEHKWHNRAWNDDRRMQRSEDHQYDDEPAYSRGEDQGGMEERPSAMDEQARGMNERHGDDQDWHSGYHRHAHEWSDRSDRYDEPQAGPDGGYEDGRE